MSDHAYTALTRMLTTTVTGLHVHPLGKVLDLPDGPYSTGLARLSAREAVRGSLLDVGDAVGYVTGCGSAPGNSSN